MHHALQNHNWDLVNKLMYLKSELIAQPNFEGKAPIDLIDPIMNNDDNAPFVEFIDNCLS